MSYNLFLDDDRTPEVVANFVSPVDLRKYYRLEKWTIVRNYPEFTHTIMKYGIPKMVSFDHDLAEHMYNKNLVDDKMNYLSDDFKIPANRTGYHCAEWLIAHCRKMKADLPTVFVHSLNPVGKENILALFQSHAKFFKGFND